MKNQEYNNQINDVHIKLNKIAEIHKTNQSKYINWKILSLLKIMVLVFHLKSLKSM
jgi:hypothetical protein